MERAEPTNADLLEAIQKLGERVARLEGDSHPQGVMVDPELTKAVRNMGRCNCLHHATFC